VFGLALIFSSPVYGNKTDNQIRQEIIQESIRSYSGSCPCPYSRTAKGHKCGKRSAYIKPGGANPYCYESDISDEMVQERK